MTKRKLPKDPRRKQQVKTFLKRYGRDGYRLAGARGGKLSSGSFDTERARLAGLKSARVRRERKEAELRKQQEREEHESS